MTPEEINETRALCEPPYGKSGIHRERVKRLLAQLQSETQRADKAEEMVAALSVWNSEDAAQVFRQKLCDEIVGKIEANKSVYHDGSIVSVSISDFNKASEEAIDIVKSVLKGEE